MALADISKDNIERRSTTRESGPDVDKSNEIVDIGQETGVKYHEEQNIEGSKTLWPQILAKKYEDPFAGWF